MLRAAEVHEQMGNLDEAARYQQYTSQRYSGQALNWFLWCLRTGGGDLDEAMEFAQQTLDEWGSELSDDNHVRAAMLEMARDEWGAAFDRMLPIGRRSRDPFYVWFTAMLADAEGAAEERSELLQRVVALRNSGDEFHLVNSENIASYVDQRLNDSPDSKFDVAFLDREIARLKPAGMTNLWYFLSEMLKRRGQDAESREYLRLAAGSPQPDMWTQFLAAHFLRVQGEELSRRTNEFVPRAELVNAGRARVLQREDPVLLVRMPDDEHVLFSHLAGGIQEWQVTEERANAWSPAKGHLIDYSPDGARAIAVDQSTQTCEIWTRNAEQPEHAWAASGAVLRAARFIPNDPDRIVFLELRHNSETVPGSSLHVRKLSAGADEWRVELGNRMVGGLWAAGLDGTVLVAGFDNLTGWLAEYRLSDGTLVRQVDVPRHSIDRLVVSADGKRSATLSRFGEVCVWDLARLEIVQRFWSYGSTIIAMSRDGRLLATAGTPTVQVYDLHAGEIIAEINDHPQAVNHAAFSPSGGRLATGANDMTVRVYEVDQLASLRPDDATPAFEFVNSLGMTLEPIPAGEFVMGERDEFRPAAGYERSGIEAERPRHQVTLTRPYFISQFETTVGQFRKFIEATSYVTDAEREGGGWHVEPPANEYVNRPDFTWRNPGFEQDDSNPVVQVTWNDARKFCEWLSEQEGRRYRLPTEAEWEHACRAGSSTSYSRSNTPWASTTGFGNTADSTIRELYDFYPVAAHWDDGYAYSAPVGRYWPNAWGLYDMHGNAYEWCSDYWEPDYYAHSPAVDPQGPESGTSRVMRGGSFTAHADDSRAAHRTHSDPGGCLSTTGFRVVLEVDAPAVAENASRVP
jgi:formylglycine-generating enzyme required for sulfatase activity